MATPDENLEVGPEGGLLFSSQDLGRHQFAHIRLHNPSDVHKGYAVCPRRQILPYLILGSSYGFLEPRETREFVIFLAPITAKQALDIAQPRAILVKSLDLSGWHPPVWDKGARSALFHQVSLQKGKNDVMSAYCKIGLSFSPPSLDSDCSSTLSADSTPSSSSSPNNNTPSFPN